MDKIIEQITQLANANDDIAVLWLYGSRAKNRARDDSDYDLAIAFQSFDLSPSDIAFRPHLLAAEWQSELGLDDFILSIVDINRIPSYLGMSILDEGVVIKGEESLRLVKEELRIMNQFEFLNFDQKKELSL